MNIRVLCRYAFSVAAIVLATIMLLGLGGQQSADAQEQATFTQVSAGGDHTCAIQTDGTPICWGDNSYRQSSPPHGIVVTQISAGNRNSCAVLTDGTPICWGDDRFGQLTPPDGITVTQVDVGFIHVCAVQSDGSPICWGSNEDFSGVVYGQATPPADITVTEVSSGIYHTCAVQTDGTPICWGADQFGQSTVPDGITVTQISAGAFHTCAILTDGTPICWGADSGRSGINVGQADAPNDITVTDISAGFRESCAVQADGTAVCWNEYGSSLAPWSGSYVQVSAGDRHACGLTTEGRVTCWGNRPYGATTPPGADVQPVAVDDAFTAAVGDEVTFNLCANDDPGNGAAEVTRISGRYGLGLTRSGDYGCIIYGTPERRGTYTYTYLLTDADGDTDEATITITITPNPVNLQPMANDDVFTGTVGEAVRFDICANDVAGNGGLLQPLRVSGWYGPGLSRTEWCVVAGTPTRAGTYTYVYNLIDSDLDRDEGTVTIIISE